MSSIRLLSPELAEIAKTDLNEDASQIENHLTTIKAWLHENGHDINGMMNDQILVAFFRGCKYNLDKVKTKLKLFFETRATFPEVMENRDPLDPTVRKVIQLGSGFGLLKTSNIRDPRIMLIRAGLFDPQAIKFSEFMKVGTMINDIMMRDDDVMVVNGMVIIVDMKNCSASQFFHMDFHFLQKLTFMKQDASPLRMKGFHIINPPFGFDTLIKISNRILSLRHKNKILFSHGNDLESLYKEFPKSVLPEEYGGDLGPIQEVVDYWEETLIGNRDYLMQGDKFNLKKEKKSKSNDKDKKKELNKAFETTTKNLADEID